MLSRRNWFLALGLVVAMAIAAFGLLLRSRRSGDHFLALPALRPLLQVSGGATADVQQASVGSLLLQTGNGTIVASLPGATPIEILSPDSATSIQPGDWLSVGAVANQVNSFAIKQVLVISAAEAATLPDPNRPPRSRNGFTGFEGEQDPHVVPSVYGQVRGVANGILTLAGPTGAVTFRLPPQSAILRLAAGEVSGIHDGDRLVYLGGADAASAKAILARPRQ
ncbi:MAG: hypothetical protein ACR2PL_24550 [Dehalococcoidia bacterium]